MQPQERADRLRIFRQELDQLELENALRLSPEQRSGLDAHLDQKLKALASQYDVDTSESQRQISFGMKIASALGGLALCAALVLFLARYMGQWPTPVQVAVLAILPFVLTAAAEWAARKETTLYYTSLICVVAFAAFVANLSILGAIFNMARTPNALAAWGVFGIALAYHFGLRLVLAAGLISVLGWVTAETNVWRGWWWWEFERRPEELMLAGIAMAALPLILHHAGRAGFPMVYRLVGMFAIFFPMLYLSAQASGSYFPWDTRTIEKFYQVFGMLAASGAVWAGIRRGWREVIHSGTAFFVIFLFVRLIDWWWDWMPKYLFFLLIGLVAIALVAVFKRLRTGLRSAL